MPRGEAAENSLSTLPLPLECTDVTLLGCIVLEKSDFLPVAAPPKRYRFPFDSVWVGVRSLLGWSLKLLKTTRLVIVVDFLGPPNGDFSVGAGSLTEVGSFSS